MFRAVYDLRQKHGLLARGFPAWNWSDRPLGYWLAPGVPTSPTEYRIFRQDRPVPFFFGPGSPPTPPTEWVVDAKAQSQEILAGKFTYFSKLKGNLGYPPADWLGNPFTNQRDTADEHWCDIASFDPQRGDIKYLWEPSRFCWAYALVRAYASERNDIYARAFWTLFESWLAANPPQMGPNWRCGQEIAIRVIACVFALNAFWNCPDTTDERIAAMVTFLAGSAQRIAGNIDQARAQMGNHAVSEATGLWTVALLFPELKHAGGWQKLARHVLEDEVRQFNWPDGSYCQHSMNYHRLMLHDYLWSMRLAQLNRQPFSDLMTERLTRSYEFLYQLQDPETGLMPNYGPNDGALILPLSGCDYQDYRPVIGAMHYLINKAVLYEPGQWQENLLWLWGSDALKVRHQGVKKTSSDFNFGGYYTLCGLESWAMVRCHTYRNRPNQADMLHCDLWWKGVNVLGDSGSYTYNDPQTNWQSYFVSSAAHNTVMLGGLDQMVKGKRFQWHTLLQSKCIARRKGDTMELWQGEHYGYRRLSSKAVCRRTICRILDDHWVIVDDILGQGSEKIALFWHLPDGPCSPNDNGVVLQTTQGTVDITVLASCDSGHTAIARGEDGDRRLGWQSLYYGEKLPRPTLYFDEACDLPLRLITLVSLGRKTSDIEYSPQSLHWSTDHPQPVSMELSFPDKPGTERSRLVVKCGEESITL